MRKLLIVIAVLMLSAAVEGGEGINSDIYFNKKIRITQNTRFAVLPFELTASWAQLPSETSTKKNVESKNTEKFELSLLNAGVTVIERNRLDKVVSEQALSKTGLTESDSIKLGKVLSADIVVLGTISMWTFHDKTNKGFIEILIKGIAVETGEIVFKTAFDSKITTTYDDFRYDMAQLETKSYKILGDKIKEVIEKK